MALTTLQRAQGALYAALAADALGSQFEFCQPAELRRKPAAELMQLQDYGPWHTLAGQPTEDGELILLQARMLVYCRGYQEEQALAAYRYWLSTEPFALGASLQRALLSGADERDYSANAMARLTPLSILGIHHSLPQIAAWAMADTALTQNAAIMQQLSGLYAMLLAKAIDSGSDADTLYQDVEGWAAELKVDVQIRHSIQQALFMPASAELRQQNPALAAWQNLLFQLLYAKSFGEAVVDTIRQGGDTGTNTVIVAAVFGAIHGLTGVPQEWCSTLDGCKPQEGVTGVDQPRDEMFWPGAARTLVQQLVSLAAE
jgi:ADP-ribosyl-[dinitrogen reductase] hydrolase